MIQVYYTYYINIYLYFVYIYIFNQMFTEVIAMGPNG